MQTLLIVIAVLFGLGVLGMIWVISKPRRVRYMIYLLKQLPYVPFRYLT